MAEAKDRPDGDSLDARDLSNDRKRINTMRSYRRWPYDTATHTTRLIMLIECGNGKRYKSTPMNQNTLGVRKGDFGIVTKWSRGLNVMRHLLSNPKHQRKRDNRNQLRELLVKCVDILNL